MIFQDAPSGWEVEPSDVGGHVVRHRHGDVSAVCYVYSHLDRVWAECTICLADLELEKPVRPSVPSL